MSRRGCACLLAIAAALAAALSGCERDDGGGGLWVPPVAPVPLTTVSGGSPFTQGCDQQAASATLYVGSEVEPFLAINPANTENRIAVWQQDRWANGAARGVLAGVSFDGGETWAQRVVPFSRCSGGSLLNGGDYARATDPWVSFGPTGIAYFMALTTTGSRSAMRVARSLDGGDTWQAPITLIDNDSPYFNDKNALTADPTDANYAYAVWDRLDAALDRGPTWFARTVDGGATWEAARAIYDPGVDAQTIGNVIVVLPDGTVLNLFTELRPTGGAFLKVIRSTDKGATWSAPVLIAQILSVGVRDPRTQALVRSGGIIASFAVGPGNEVWAAWQDSRYSAPDGVRDGVVLAHSESGGLTWDAPVLVSPNDTQAFTPAVHVAGDGTVGVSYYDFRDDERRDQYLLTGHWLALSSDGTTFDERRISGPFDLAIAPNALGLFLGDYTGLASDAYNFVPLFAQTRPSLDERTDLYTVTLPILSLAKSAGRRYAAPRAAAPELTPEWSALVRAHAERARKHFYERPAPRPPKYVPPP